MNPRGEPRDTAEAWIAGDPDPDAREELLAVLARTDRGDDEAAAELRERFSTDLSFGTAGLRGTVRAGSNGMNVAVVTRTTAGVAAWLRANGDAGGTVVVGRDARHGSEAFARAAAGVLAAAGFDAAVLPEPLPTPVLAFAARALGAVAGIQITASHNPPADNGYKLYLRGGIQLVPPTDREIEREIAAQPSAAAIPADGAPRVLGSDILRSYLDSASAVARGESRSLRIALTPLHGVGGTSCLAALRGAGFTDLHAVREQFDPDPDFPTVGFPNPEEPGAADRVLALAESVDADLALALDPDADRCAVGIRERDGWHMLRGDETGVLLAEHVLNTTVADDPLVATTIVSSSMLRAIAGKHGARYDETLTGFKWLVRAGGGHGTGLVYAYEEALGHCVDPDVVRDKDGISAAVLAADLAATAKRRGRSLPELRDELYAEHGVHLTDQVSLRFADISRIGAAMRALRGQPPTALAGVGVRAEDLLPDTDALRLAGNGVRVVVRPSGTEPKLKAYLEVSEPPGDGDTERSKQRLGSRLAALRGDVTNALSKED